MEITKCSTLNSLEFRELAYSKDRTLAFSKDRSLAILQNPNIGFKETTLASFLDSAALELTSTITLVAKASIPIAKKGARPKPWWNTELLELRKAMLQKQRAFKQDLNLKVPYLQARNGYFLAIKQAKRHH